MTVDELVGAAVREGLTDGQSLENAQNSINRVLSRMGVIGSAYDRWYRCGRQPDGRTAVQAADLVVEALALAVNLAGADAIIRLLAQRGER